MPYFVYQDEADEWRWRYKSLDNKVIALSSSGYAQKHDCLHSIEQIKHSEKEPVIELSKFRSSD